MAITDSWLRANNNKAQASIKEKTDRDGLSIRPSKKGKLVFQLRFVFNSKPCRMDLGTYPLISLKQAREDALRFKAELEKGHDPRIIKKTDKDLNIHAITIEQLFKKWYESYCVVNKKNHEDICRSFEIHVLPKIGHYPVDKVSTDKWVTLLEVVTKRAPGIAVRLLINAKQMLSWADRRNLVERNALRDINSKADLNITQGVGKRSLSDDEIRMLLICLDESKMAAKNKLFIRLCLIYGCRNGELRLSQKTHFDFDLMIWTIPIENHKMGKSTGKPLVRPITAYIKQLLEDCMQLSHGSEFMFNNRNSAVCMSCAAPISLPYNVMQFLRREKDYEMAHWSMHDLRKTARTNFSTLTQPHVAEIMLGHKLPGHWMTYDLHDYIKEQKDCLEKWTEKINTISNK